MPLSLMVSATPGGGADVLVAATERELENSDWSDLPRSVAEDVRGLPGVLERALG